MSMDDLDALAEHYLPEYWEEREHRGHCGLSVDDEERNVVDLTT